MPNKVSFSKKEIMTMAAEGKTVSEMAEVLFADESELASFYSMCYKEDKDSFPISLLVTKPWLEKMLENNPVSRIASIAGCSRSTIKRLMKDYRLDSKQKLSELLTPEVLYTLFAEQNLTDREIAERYNCSFETIKKLRAKNKINYSTRVGCIADMSIEHFHKLYVQCGFSPRHIAAMLGCNIYKVNRLKNQFISSGHPLSAEIEAHSKFYAFTDLNNLLMETVDPAVLYEQLKEHSLAEVAEMYELIPPSEPGVETFTPEWLEAVLKKMEVPQIIRDYHVGIHFIREMMKENDLKRVPVLDRLDENVVRTLFVDNGWDDEQIAKALGSTPNAIATLRSKKGIKPSQRKKLTERLNADKFAKLYLDENLTLAQIATLFDAPMSVISDLRAKYGKSNPAILSHRSTGVTRERLAYLKKQLKFEGMKK